MPFHDEEANVDRSLRAALDVAPRLAEDIELVLVDDGSEDGTYAALERWREGMPQCIRILRHDLNQGYGRALWSGLQEAHKEWVAYTDGDGQFDLSDLLRFLPHVSSDKVLTGVRRERSEGWLRDCSASLWTCVVNRALGLELRDVDCALKLFPRPFLQQIAPRSRGAAIDAEIFLEAKGRGYRIQEIEVAHYPRLHGRSSGLRPRVIARAFLELGLLTWRLHALRGQRRFPTRTEL